MTRRSRNAASVDRARSGVGDEGFRAGGISAESERGGQAEELCGDDDLVTHVALAAGRGDRDALNQFIILTQRDVWRLIAYLTDVGSADDLTQETFLRAIGSLPRFGGRSSARTWLFSIARRVIIDKIRYDRCRPRSSADTCLSNVVELERFQDKRQAGATFEEVIEIRMLLERLEPQRRQALLLTQVLGLSYAEAAKVCGCAIGTIRSRVARARSDLLTATDQTGCAAGTDRFIDMADSVSDRSSAADARYS